MITVPARTGYLEGWTMLAVLAMIAFVVGLILRVVGTEGSDVADPWVWLFGGLALWAAHTVSPYTPWRRPGPVPPA